MGHWKEGHTFSAHTTGGSLYRWIEYPILRPNLSFQKPFKKMKNLRVLRLSNSHQSLLMSHWLLMRVPLNLLHLPVRGKLHLVFMMAHKNA